VLCPMEGSGMANKHLGSATGQLVQNRVVSPSLTAFLLSLFLPNCWLLLKQIHTVCVPTAIKVCTFHK
jgi:hypothetical protein